MNETTRTGLRLLLPTLALVLAGCASTGDEERVDERDDGDETTQTDDDASGADTSGAGDGEAEGSEVWALEDRDALEGEELDQALEDPDSPISERTLYFDFDSSTVREEDMAILESHGSFLADHPAQEITVEGHTDERGSREYNLALGERRAQSVKRILVLNGASEDQIEVVSFGEEEPVADGSSEDAYQQNRRAELVYKR